MSSRAAFGLPSILRSPQEMLWCRCRNPITFSFTIKRLQEITQTVGINRRDPVTYFGGIRIYSLGEIQPCVFSNRCPGPGVAASLRTFGCVITVLCSSLCAEPQLAWAAPSTTTTALSVTSAGNAVTTATAGSVVTLTATVSAGGSPVAPARSTSRRDGEVRTDIHLLGTAQLTACWTATLKLRPGVGNHSYKVACWNNGQRGKRIDDIGARGDRVIPGNLDHRCERQPG